MKLSAPRTELLKAVQAVFPAIERKNIQPILANFLIKATSKETKITATDLELELAIITTLPAEQPGETTLPARRLYDILRALPEEATVSITTEESKAIVKSGRSRFTLKTMAADDYPVHEQRVFEAEITVSPAVLSQALAEAAYAVANQDVRYYLNGCFFEYLTDEGKINIVSTDGHRLAFRELSASINSAEPSGCAILPTKGLQALMKIIQADQESPVVLSFCKSHLQVRVGTTCMTSILIDGKYPDYQRVIPKESTKIVIAERARLRDVLRRAKIVLAGDKAAGVRLTLAEWLLTVHTHNTDQEEAEEDLDVNYTGESMEIGFNADYLIEALTAIPGETVKIGLTDSKSGMLLEEGSGQSGKHVVMPMRL